jgi:hypothetical protein
MTTITRRLAALEAELTPPAVDDLDEYTLQAIHQLSRSSLWQTIERYATYFAEMRYRAEGHHTTGHVDDWKRHTVAEERERRNQDEHDRLDSLLQAEGNAGFHAWTESAVTAGWPALTGVLIAITAAGFWDTFRANRERTDAARNVTTPHAAAWRRLWPEWRPEMTDDAALAFEERLMRETRAPVPEHPWW